MTDDTEPPKKIISRRKSHLKGPQASDSDATSEPVVPESNLNDNNLPSASDYVVPVEGENYEEPIPTPEPVPEPPRETQEGFSPTEKRQEQTEETATESTAPDLRVPASGAAQSSDIPVAAPLAEEETIPQTLSKKEKKKARREAKKSEESMKRIHFEEETGMKRLSRKERKALQRQEMQTPVFANPEMPERRKGFSIFRFSQRRETLSRAKAEIEENQRKLFGTPKKGDAVSIQKMTQPISRRVDFVGGETTAPQVPGHMKVALALFRDYYTLRPVNTKLEEGLRKSKMPYSTVQYESVVMLATLLVVCIGSIALGVMFYFFGELVLLGIPVVVLGAVALYVIALRIPGSKINKRRKNIEARLPMALAYIATMASADIPVEHIMYELGKTTEYGEISKEARAISASSRLFGNDIVTALREEAKYSPSGKLAEFLSGITSTVTSGGSLKDYFTMKAKQFQSELSTLIKQNAESVGVLAESYVTVGVAFPLMFIVILGVLVAMTPNASAIVLLLYLMVLMMIPLITFVFAFIIQSTVREVPI